ncbi:hypothetical protein BDW74DRAFT_188328 [Aspergillus multicolor]|uniref:uncharacterized protein n=1 Tax=Aspergillus multicolor TaxID=41759 RepID=UPI003CCDC401
MDRDRVLKGRGPRTRAQIRARTRAKPDDPVPLSRVVEAFLQPLPPREHIYWYTLKSLLYLQRYGSPKSPIQGLQVVSKLSRPQRCVLALLEEWWAGRPGDSAAPRVKRWVFRLAFASASDTETLRRHLAALKELAGKDDIAMLREAAVNKERELGTCSERSDSDLITADGQSEIEEQPESIAGFSRYHEHMMRLYFHELTPHEFSLPLSVVRKIGAEAAALERIAYYSLMNTPSCMEVKRYNLRSTAAGQERKRRLKEYAQCIPGIVQPCPWLGNDEDSSALPLYLWDVNHSRTVHTEDLKGKAIRYAIVSHTWGRWREGDAMEHVRGVPWRVPKISRYDVTQLPRMIKRVGFAEPYMWMDLLCIPQEMSVDWQAAECKFELPRQLVIFRNAGTAVIWLFDVDSWDASEAAITWLGLKYLTVYEDNAAKYRQSADIQKALHGATAANMSACDLVTTDTGEDVAVAWFTSLWTVQEILIRPDMVLLDRHWRPLLAGDKLAVTLDNLRFFINEPSVMEGAPHGISTLMGMFLAQGVFTLMAESRLDPLICSVNRESTSPRAPAIMSAIGATDWFRGRTLKQFESAEEADALVLGWYPLDFVEEVRNLAGAAFFSCGPDMATLVLDENGQPAHGHPLKGTMLPFMRVSGYSSYAKSEPNFVTDVVDHPSIRSWVINADGSVSIPTAALVASNCMELETSYEVWCSVQSNDPQNMISEYAVPKPNVLLGDWINSFAGQAHAICTMLSESEMAGIILHRLHEPDYYVKAGVFELHAYSSEHLKEEAQADLELIPVLDVVVECDVDWHVL